MTKKSSYFALIENKKVNIFFQILFLIIIISIIFIFRYYLWPFLFCLILYIALRPIHEKLLKLIKNRTLSSTIVIIIIFALIIIPLYYLAIILADQTFQLYNIIHENIDSNFLKEIHNNKIVIKIADNFNVRSEEIVRKISSLIEQASVTVFKNLTGIISFPISFTINFFFMILMLFFFLKDGYKLDQTIYDTLPFPDDIEKDVINRLKEVIKILLAGNLIIMLLQGFFVGIGFYIVDIRVPLFWGSVSAILSLIPAIGTTLVWLPAVLYLIIIKSYAGALFVGIWSLFWYLFLENFIKPKVFGKRLEFHPIVFFFLLLGSIQAFGLPGVIVGPILLTLFYSFWEIYKIIEKYKGEPGGIK